MAGLEDILGDLADEPRSGFQFPSSTRGVSSYGQQQINRWTGLLRSQSGLDDALSELQMAQTQFEFQSKKRQLEVSLREQRDKNRIADDSIKGMQLLDTLNPESPDYFSKRVEVLKTIPYANYDPAFRNVMSMYDDRNRRYSELERDREREDSRIKQAEDKIRHRETYTMYKGLLDSMTGPEVYEFGDEVINLKPDSPMEDLIGAVNTIKKSRATTELDRDLKSFGFTPLEFGGDLSAKARAVSAFRKDRDDLSKQLEQATKFYTQLSKEAEALTNPEATNARDEQGRYIKELNAKLQRLTQPKDKDGNLLQKQETRDFGVEGMNITKQVIDAKVGTEIKIKDRVVKVNAAMKEMAKKELEAVEKQKKESTAPMGSSQPVSPTGTPTLIPLGA
jgi:hypothetical protein